MRWLFVIARNSSFTYKGRAMDVKQVGRELGVRYVLEGSVRKAAKPSTHHRPAHRCRDGRASVGRSFRGRLGGYLRPAGPGDDQRGGCHRAQTGASRDRTAKRKPTESLDAYDYYLRGMAAIHQWTRRPTTRRLAHVHPAIELDPQFAAAMAWRRGAMHSARQPAG